MLERPKTKASKVFCFVFHTGFKIWNFNVWSTKHLMQASWTELALQWSHLWSYKSKNTEFYKIIFTSIYYTALEPFWSWLPRPKDRVLWNHFAGLEFSGSKLMCHQQRPLHCHALSWLCSAKPGNCSTLSLPTLVWSTQVWRCSSRCWVSGMNIQCL